MNWDLGPETRTRDIALVREVVLDLAFYRACQVAITYQDENRWNSKAAQQAFDALALLERVGDGRKPRQYGTVESRTWVVFICSTKSAPNPEWWSVKLQIPHLIDGTDRWFGTDPGTLEATKRRYEAFGWDPAAPQPFGPA